MTYPVIAITRQGATLQDFADDIRTGVGAKVLETGRAAVRADIAAGTISADTDLTYTVGYAGVRRPIPNLDINPLAMPYPPMELVIAGSSGAVVIEALKWIETRLRRTSPPPSGVVKRNNSYRYNDSMQPIVDGALVPAFPPESEIVPQSRYGFTNIAPHSGVVEYRSGDNIYVATARIAIKKFPDLSIILDWINSDWVGIRYGRGTGGPVARPRPYALPRITVGLTGFSGNFSRGRRTVRARQRR